ncbi:hypothetical protein Lesp02_74340 [Lentzea sp. NBRC 105346]|nr:hypothetical protein Lesp02_74340 [Lentzea sp. NBRC 105346]
MFGPLTPRFSDGDVELGPPRRRAVLAMLVINAGKIVSTAALIEGIWGTAPPACATATLQSYVSRLRGLLTHPGVSLSHRAPGYRLVVPPEHTDATRFERLVEQGLTAPHDEAFSLLTSALAMWTAPPYEDLTDYEFVRQEVVRLERVRLTAVEQLAATAFALDRDHEVLPTLEYESARNPTRERLVGLLMRAQYRAGRQADALHTFDRTRRLLADELGADVGPDLQRVHAQIIRHDPALRPDANRPRVPSPRSPRLSVVPDHDPRHGRETELRRLNDLLDTARGGEGRIALVTGEAGVGKTWLVEELRKDCRADSQDGADLVSVYCPQADGMPAYWPWTQVLRQLATLRPDAMRRLPTDVRATLAFLLPELRPGPDLDTTHTAPTAFEVHEAISRALCHFADRPLVIALEDFQWADRCSLAMLRFVARQLAGAKVLLITTFRTFRIAYDADLRVTLAVLEQQPVVEAIRLTGLDRTATAELVSAAGGGTITAEVGAALYERTLGNPYFVLDLVRNLPAGAGAEEVRTFVPSGLHDVILERLSSVPPEVRLALDVCSTADDGVPPADLTVSDETIRVAAQSGLLRMSRGVPRRVRVAHPLVRDVIRHEIDAMEVNRAPC